ncbi:GntR family transcriptional regulator [Caulobacter sp.]|uniref:GntR family transcriptional regulator n=1 Tax=Caulobacter sp. TaxID=78 RepID=UPI003BB0B685
MKTSSKSKGKEAAASAAPTADDLAQALRARIQKSELAPGEWLREVKLCSEFGVGRSIVRRALRTLADDGLIEIEENRGARVSATTVEEVFDLYEVRAALYGMAARFACLRGSDSMIRSMMAKIDRLLSDAESKAPAEQIIEVSESIFSDMIACASADAQRMIESVRRKTRFHFSYAALAINTNAPGPYEHWRHVRAALAERDADRASQSARDILYFMQGEVARIMLARGPRLISEAATTPNAKPKRRSPPKRKPS